MKADLTTLLRQRPLLADGAMGTQLQQAGLAPGDCGELWNLTQAARVLEIQRRYVEAGADLIITNTFGGSRFALERHHASEHVTAINRAGAEVARSAAADRAWVLGDIGPFGGFLAPLGEHAEQDVYDGFLEQARALIEGGVDGIIIETMSAIDEARLAMRAARAAGARFVIASMAYDATRVGARTMMGTAPREAAAALMDADVIGANCGTSLTVAHHAAIVHEYRSAAPAKPIITQPNAGLPVRVNDGFMYPEGPEEMAAGIAILLDAGASIVGGCCGTTPDHIRACAHAMREFLAQRAGAPYVSRPCESSAGNGRGATSSLRQAE